MFHDPSEFEFVSRFTQGWADIRREYESLGNKMLDVHRIGTHEEYFTQIVSNNGWAPSWSVGSIERNFDWLTYALSYQGQFPDEASARFPLTMALIESAPCITAAAFSKMNPMSMIAPHTHAELGGNLLTFHLGIDVEPRKSYLVVDDVLEQELEKKPLVFDGSAEHFAVNMGSTSRTILYVEFDRSLM